LERAQGNEKYMVFVEGHVGMKNLLLHWKCLEMKNLQILVEGCMEDKKFVVSYWGIIGI